jgi:hypothetical protein
VGDTPIDVAHSAAEDLLLRVAIGACQSRARTGEGDAWVAGTYHDPTDKRPTRIVEEGASVTNTEEEPSFERISAVFGGVPRYELRLGRQRPFALSIETGASLLHSSHRLEARSPPSPHLTMWRAVGPTIAVQRTMATVSTD